MAITINIAGIIAAGVWVHKVRGNTITKVWLTAVSVVPINESPSPLFVTS
jgi:hypothetical protein